MAGRKECYAWLLIIATILCINTALAQILTPTYFNVASGKQITATATCGEGVPEPERGELYCKLTGNTGDVLRPSETDIIHGQYCDYCNIYNSQKRHPITFAIDGTEQWWQSPPISRGLTYNEVNVTIDLGQLYHVAYIIIKSANSPRPGQWILERSTDYGETYQAWQYFAETASDCNAVFGMESLDEIKNDDDVICTDEYSDIVPLEDGEIVVSLVNGRPSANNFSYSEVLQNWTKATNIRLRLLRTNTLFGHLMAVARQDPTVTRRYYYSIKDISIGGRCFCNGHASVCDTLDNRGRLQCTCEHNTCGAACDQCCPGFVQKPWMPATLQSSNECEPCNCFGHSTECYYDEQVNAEGRSIDIYGIYAGGGVCQNCQHNTEGINCNQCKDGYYRPDGRDLASPYVCERCQCDPFFSTGNCADITGECQCRPEYAGEGCSECNEGYYGYPSCRPCDCNINGTLDKICQNRGGECPCKPSYAGRNCDRCALGYYNFPACEPCACDSIGSQENICDITTGQCRCHDVYNGRTCDECKDGFYGYPACRDCYCNAIGTTEEICDKDVGTCLCNENFGEPRCDRCASGYYNYPVCEACNCGPGSTSDFCYDNGQCQCSPNFSGAKCDQCAAGYYRYPECVPCECNVRGAFSVSCDGLSGQCDCRSNFQGRMCEQCAKGFYNYPLCEECNCDPAGVRETPGQPLGGCGTATEGACLCKDRVQGRTCNTCQPTFWNMQISNPVGCEECDCNPVGTIGGNSVCSVSSGQCHCKGLVTNRNCDECVDGTYQIQAGNAFGCRDCACDVGGAIHGVCNKETGQCICRPRVSGVSCDEPMPVHYYPTLFQYMFEIESGTTPDGRDLRIGYNNLEFPDFSYLGYAVMSNIQPIVHVPINVERSDIYRITLRYIYPGDTTVYGKITLTPSGSGSNIPRGSEQSSPVNFYSANDPQLVTVEGGSLIFPFVLDPGQWIVKIEAPEGVLLDYGVLLPSAYYEAPILQVRVNEPCVAGFSQELCNNYVFPTIDTFPVVRGTNGYYDNNGESEPIQIYADPDLLDDLGIDDLALLDNVQPSLFFIIPIKDLADYIFIVEYYGGGPGEQQATFDLWTLQDKPSGTLNLYDCSYLCRSVVVDADGRPMIFDVDITDPTGQILPIGNPWPLGISQIIAIPVDQWSEDLITPALKCVKTASGDCVPSSYPSPPGHIRIETGDDGPRIPGEIGSTPDDKRLPPAIQDPSTSLMYLSVQEGYPTLTIEDIGSEPLDGSWVFIVHYYQPRNTAVDVNFEIPGEFDGIGDFTGHYCPHVSGCRAVVTRTDGDPTFDLTGLGQGITFSLPPESDGEIWIDYILAVPESTYTPTLLIEDPQDRARDFITECGQQSFYLNPEAVSEFCREAVYSLSVEYNNGAQQCECNIRGSTELECNEFGGQCSCRDNIIGRQCDRCRIGYYDFPYCRKCTCVSGVCNEDNGACICPENVIGVSCDRCAPNTYGYNPLVGCVECECDERGASDFSCHPETGQCTCYQSIGGRRCDQCEPGFSGYPFCSPCDCDNGGTTADVCDQLTGECICKENVDGSRCDQCAPGTFYLNPETEKGCIKCFCFGVSTDCKKYNRRRGKIDMMSNFGVTNVRDPYLQESANLINLYVQGTGEDPTTAIYWTLPNKYMGNKLVAYGGQLEYTVQNNPQPQGTNQPIRRPDIIISGNNITIMYTHNQQPQPRDYMNVVVDMLESNFQYSFSARPVMRDDFMMVLSNIDSFMIRAQYLDTVLDASIGDLSMEIAKRDGTGSKAHDVERCSCPPQYTGLSCEKCAEGYYRADFGAYLGTCIPCNCNNHADRCDTITGQCIDCRDGTQGLHCDQCEIGYFGDATQGTPNDCQLCACPYPENGRNFATTCAISPVGELLCFCLAGHVGERCDRCGVGFYGDPSQLGGYCRKCECNFNSDPNAPGLECDPLFGGCLKCRPGTTGDSCELCEDWYWGDAIQRKDCQPCNCDQCGSEYCEKTDGNCECKDGVIGSRCDRCAPTYWGFDRCTGCTACECSFASYSSQCDANTGQCDCKPGVSGSKCDMCDFGYWNWTPEGCERCECDDHLRCDMMTGECICPPGATGERCDECADRYVLTLDGCQACDECVHELLDVMDDLKDQIDGATINITEISVGYLAFQRLNNLNESIMELQPKLEYMVANNMALSSNMSGINMTLGDLSLWASEVETKSIDTLATADATSQEAEATRVKAEVLEAQINATLEAIRDAINAMYNSSTSSGNITADEIALMVLEARKIVMEIAARNFSANEEMAKTELELAKDVLARALMLRNASQIILERAHNVSMNVNDFLDKLNDLVNQSAMANNMSDTVNEILMRHTPPAYQMLLDLVDGNITAATEENTNATMLLDEAERFLDDANKALQGSSLNASKLTAAIDKLKPRIPILESQAEELEPLVEMAKDYASNLTKQAEYLDSLLRDTRELAANAVKAANAYRDIVDAINAAEQAAKAALNASMSAEQEAGSFGDRPEKSLKRSTRLGNKAVKAMNKISDLDDLLGGVKDSVDKVKGDLDSADGTLTGIRDGIDGIPEDSSKCTITVCESVAPGREEGNADAVECQPGFTGEECDAAILSEQAEEAVMTAMAADDTAQKAQDIADWVNARLPELQEKAATLPEDVNEANKALDVAGDSIDRARADIDTFRELDMALTAKHKALANLTRTMTYNLDELRESINQARTIAAGVKVAMKFVTDSSVELRRPENYQEPSTRNVIELYFNTRMDDALLYYAGGPEPTDNYMAIEIVNSKPVLRYNLGGDEDGEVIVEEDVSDGQWHKIVAERSANTGLVVVFSERGEVPGAGQLAVGSTLTFHPDARFYLGGVPPDVVLPTSVASFKFEGCIDEFVYDSQLQGLWNFENGENVAQGCLRNISTLGVPTEEGWFFDGGGYIIMERYDRITSTNIITLTFKTFKHNGLLYFVGSPSMVDYLALELRNGKVYAHWDLGNGVGGIESERMYNDGEWTTVQVVRQQQNGILQVQRGEEVEELTGASPGTAQGLETTVEEYFGGLTGIRDMAYKDVTRQGFRGCIKDVKFGSDVVDFTKNAGTIGTSPTCVATSITDIAFDRNGGYMSWTPINIAKQKGINFQFRTEEQEGLILYTANDAGTNYLAVAIVGGEVHVVGDSGDDRVELRSAVNTYNDGELHTVSINKDSRKLSLSVDDDDNSETLFAKSKLRTEGVLYLGGLPDDANIQSGILPTTSPFNGCIINLLFDGQLLSMISDILAENNAITNTCPLDEGYITPILSNVTMPSTPFPTAPGLSMEKCALPLDPAQSEMDPADEGAFQFGITPNSRHEYEAGLPNEFRQSGTISLDVRTSAFNGFLFYVADARQIDREFAFLKDGYPVFGYDYGSGPILITSNTRINDGEWHSLSFIRVPQKTGIIELDGVEVGKGEIAGNSAYLRTSTPIYVGGVPSDYSPKGIEDGSTGSLLGCIKNFALNGVEQTNPTSYDVEPCSGIKEPGVFFGPQGGHVVLDPQFVVGNTMEVRMSLKARSNNGVIFSCTDTPKGDFMSLEMVNGTLHLRSDNGAGVFEATYSPPEGGYFMCDGNWHDVIAIKNLNTVQLIVDEDEGLVGEGSDRTSSANTKHPLYLGGLPDGIDHTGIMFNEPYVGCIRDVMFGGNLVEFNTLQDGVVGDVDLQACPSR